MKVVDPGNAYDLSAGNRLTFLRKEHGRIIRDGTTNEEVLQVLIDRVTTGYKSLPCHESVRAVHYLREALAAMEERTARRIAADVEGTQQPHYDRPGRSNTSAGGSSPDGGALDLGPN